MATPASHRKVPSPHRSAATAPAPAPCAPVLAAAAPVDRRSGQHATPATALADAPDVSATGQCVAPVHDRAPVVKLLPTNRYRQHSPPLPALPALRVRRIADVPADVDGSGTSRWCYPPHSLQNDADPGRAAQIHSCPARHCQKSTICKCRRFLDDAAR